MVILDLYKKKIDDDKKINLIARVKFNRSNKKIGFLTLNDGTTLNNLQVVYKADTINNFLEITKLKIGTIINVNGLFKNTTNSKQAFELLANKIEVLSLCNEDYLLQKKEQSNEFLREIAHLRQRTDFFNSVFRIRSVVQYACHKFFFENNFVNLHSPIITGNDAEGAGESFIVTNREDNKYEKDFFGKRAFLTVSGQLNAEAYAQSYKNVYTFSPAFRAENSNTTRHAAEFWMIEPEIAFANIYEAIDLGTKLVKYVLEFTLKNSKTELEYLEKTLKKPLIKEIEKNIKEKFEIITYTQAIEILESAVKKGYKFDNNKIKWGMDLQTEHEKYICEKIYAKPVYIINYPKVIKAFYMKQNDDNKTVAGFDLLVPGIGELIGGSERESSIEKIKEICLEKKVDVKNLGWYLDLRKYGYYKSAGFGLGFDRLIMYITGVNNIRDIIPFPRTPKNLKF